VSRKKYKDLEVFFHSWIWGSRLFVG